MRNKKKTFRKIKENKDRDKIKNRIQWDQKNEKTRRQPTNNDVTGEFKEGNYLPKPEFLPFSVIILSGCTSRADFGPFSVHKTAIPPYRC